jgi:hydrogenase maturation protease
VSGGDPGQAGSGSTNGVMNDAANGTTNGVANGASAARVLVAGIGHVLLGDDAIGPSCVRGLRARYDLPPHVELADLGAPGLDLVLHLASADIVLIIDALRGVPPGSLHVFDLAAPAASHGAAGQNTEGQGAAGESIGGQGAARLDTHGLALEESVLTARLSGDRPSLVRIIGLGGASFELGIGLSEIARARMEALTARVMAELAALGITCHPRAHEAPLDIWWEP